jgi:hypothetical protein
LQDINNFTLAVIISDEKTTLPTLIIMWCILIMLCSVVKSDYCEYICVHIQYTCQIQDRVQNSQQCNFSNDWCS